MPVTFPGRSGSVLRHAGQIPDKKRWAVVIHIRIVHSPFEDLVSDRGSEFWEFNEQIISIKD